MHLPPQQVIAFTNAQMISYFVTRTADDGMPVGDFRSLNKSAYYIFHCGNVQEVEVCQESGSNTLFVRAICLPEMKKHTMYKTVVRLDSKSYEVDGAECECVAGKGPTASCKHIAALCEDFSRKRQLPSYLTCTDRLQTWNQPRPRKLQPIPVESLRTCMKSCHQR